jgi:serine phosphatase RsbU (regulator of sigma subunit)
MDATWPVSLHPRSRADPIRRHSVRDRGAGLPPFETERRRPKPPASRASFRGAALTVWNAPAGNHPAGGDWCEVFAISDHVLAFSIGDVCGHGVSASNEMVAMREAIDAAARDFCDPADVLKRANVIACRHERAVPVTAVVALLDTSANTLTFANAGHPPPLTVGTRGHLFLERYPADVPLGIGGEHTAISHVIEVPPRTLIVFYTDGLTEHERDPIKGERQLRLAAAHAYRKPRSNAAQTIVRRILSDSSAADDVAILTVRTPARWSGRVSTLPPARRASETGPKAISIDATY